MENQEVELSPEQEEMIRRGAEETEEFLRDPRHWRYMNTDRNKERMIQELDWRPLTAENLHDVYVDLVMQKGLDLKPMPDKELPKPDPFSGFAFQNGRPVKIGGTR
jgi:hypothetical protein